MEGKHEEHSEKEKITKTFEERWRTSVQTGELACLQNFAASFQTFVESHSKDIAEQIYEDLVNGKFTDEDRVLSTPYQESDGWVESGGERSKSSSNINVSTKAEKSTTDPEKKRIEEILMQALKRFSETGQLTCLKNSSFQTFVEKHCQDIVEQIYEDSMNRSLAVEDEEFDVRCDKSSEEISKASTNIHCIDQTLKERQELTDTSEFPNRSGENSANSATRLQKESENSNETIPSDLNRPVHSEELDSIDFEDLIFRDYEELRKWIKSPKVKDHFRQFPPLRDRVVLAYKNNDGGCELKFCDTKTQAYQEAYELKRENRVNQKCTTIYVMNFSKIVEEEQTPHTDDVVLKVPGCDDVKTRFYIDTGDDGGSVSYDHAIQQSENAIFTMGMVNDELCPMMIASLKIHGREFPLDVLDVDMDTPDWCAIGMRYLKGSITVIPPGDKSLLLPAEDFQLEFQNDGGIIIKPKTKKDGD